MSRTNICCIFNIAPHYRAPIFTLMDVHLKCDFYLGDKVAGQIKLMDYESLSGYQKTLANKRAIFGRFLWQQGAWPLIFKPYKHYIITGSPGCLSNWILLLLAIPMRKKVYAWTHGMKGEKSGKRKLFEKTFYRLCHKLLLYGEYSKQIMLKEGFKSEKLIPFYNSLDYAKQLEVRKGLKKNDVYQKHFNNLYPVIVYIGRIQKSKKLDMLVETVESLLKEGISSNLVFIGGNVDGDELQKLVAQKALSDHVWFYGPSYDEAEIGILLYNASACVSPGPVGLTALHALTYGCPMISNDDLKNQMPEYEAIIPGVNGDLFKNDDLQDLVQTVKRWIVLSEEEREKNRLASYQIIDEKWNPFNQIKILKLTLGMES